MEGINYLLVIYYLIYILLSNGLHTTSLKWTSLEVIKEKLKASQLVFNPSQLWASCAPLNYRASSSSGSRGSMGSICPSPPWRVILRASLVHVFIDQASFIFMNIDIWANWENWECFGWADHVGRYSDPTPRILVLLNQVQCLARAPVAVSANFAIVCVWGVYVTTPL